MGERSERAVAQAREAELVAPVLFPERAYLEPITGIAPRVMLAIGSTWGLCFFTLMSLLEPAYLATIGLHSVVGGATFGLFWGAWYGWYVKRFHRCLLRQPADYFGPQPQIGEEGVIVEILCNRRQGRTYVGGKLVLTSSALWFLPHNRNGRHFRQPVRMPLDEVSDFEGLPRGLLERWLAGGRPDLLPGALRIVTASRDAHEFNIGTQEMVAALVGRLQPRLPGAPDVERAIAAAAPR
jgi:hypothetical protein